MSDTNNDKREQDGGAMLEAVEEHRKKHPSRKVRSIQEYILLLKTMVNHKPDKVQ